MNNKIINPDAFGDPKTYKSLIGFTSLLNQIQNKNHIAHINSIINEFNLIYKKTSLITDLEFRLKIIDLLRIEYRNKEKELNTKYNQDLVSHLINFILTKLKVLFKETNLDCKKQKSIKKK